MKYFLLSFVALLLITPAVFADFPDKYPASNQIFHPTHPLYYQNDNLRLQLKKRADIERASESAIHFDEEAHAYYRCDWNYNKALGTWTCNKSFLGGQQEADSVTACPYGYRPNPWNTGCNKVDIPLNGQLNRQGNGWDCIDGYRMNAAQTGCISLDEKNKGQDKDMSQPKTIIRYIYMEDEADSAKEKPKPPRMPQTGPAISFIFLTLFSLIAVSKGRLLFNINP